MKDFLLFSISSNLFIALSNILDYTTNLTGYEIFFWASLVFLIHLVIVMLDQEEWVFLVIILWFSIIASILASISPKDITTYSSYENVVVGNIVDEDKGVLIKVKENGIVIHDEELENFHLEDLTEKQIVAHKKFTFCYFGPNKEKFTYTFK